MGMQVGSRGGRFAEVNVVPLIDILLVLLVIFLILPSQRQGLPVSVPQPSNGPTDPTPLSVIVIQVGADGSLKINEEPVTWDRLPVRLEEIYTMRASRIAFIRGDQSLEFSVVARVIDSMRGENLSVGLLTPQLEQSPQM